MLVALGLGLEAAVVFLPPAPRPPRCLTVPHLPPLGNDDADPEARASLDSLQAKLGRVPNMYRTLAHAPKVLAAAAAMAGAIRGGLAPKLRELAYLKVADLTACHV